MKKLSFLLVGAALLASVSCAAKTPEAATAVAPTPADSVATVYFIKDITPENIIKIYEALGRPVSGKVGVKISTGESGGHNYLKPELIKDFVKAVDGTIIECNTAYGGSRATTKDHLATVHEHGFDAIAPVDIMDAKGQVKLPVAGGKHLTYDIVGANYPKYDFTVVLSHFKGHAMGGFGGAIKNISIGCASSDGKRWIHTGGKSKDEWLSTDQDVFLESMAEAAKAIMDHAGDKILYISIANNLSVDCDCSNHPEKPQMADLGIFASLDPVALDKACTDAVRTSSDPGKVHLIERIDSRHGMHTLDYAQSLGMGTQKYKLVTIE